MPRNRPTYAVMEERVELVRTLLLRRVSKSTIKKVMREKYREDFSARTIEDYIARARQIIAENIGRGRQSMRAESLATYEAVIASPESNPFAKIKAQERINKLMTLEGDADAPDLEKLLALLPDSLAGPIRRAVAAALPGGETGRGGGEGDAG